MGAARLIGFGRGVALAWLVSRGDFGAFGVALLVVNVLLPVCTAGLYEGVLRYAPAHEAAGTLKPFVIRSTSLVLGIATVACVALFLFAEPVGGLLFTSSNAASEVDGTALQQLNAALLARASAGCLWTLAAYHTLLGFLRGLRMFRATCALELLASIVFTVTAVAGALLGYVKPHHLINAYSIGCLFSVLLLGPGLWVFLPPADVKPGVERDRPGSTLLVYSAWAAATALLWHALSYYPMWYLLKVSDTATVGAFHAVRMVTQLLQVAAVAMIAVVSSNVVRAWELQGREKAIPTLSLLTRAGLIALMLGASVLSLMRPLVLLLFPSSFAAAKEAYDPLVAFFFLVSAVGLLTVRLNLLEKTRHVCICWLLGAVTNVVVLAFLIPPFGQAAPLTEATSLSLAAWSGVAGVSVALLSCIWVVGRLGLRVGLGSWILMLTGAAFGFGPWIMLTVVVPVMLLTATTSLVLARDERRLLRHSLKKAAGLASGHSAG